MNQTQSSFITRKIGFAMWLVGMLAVAGCGGKSGEEHRSAAPQTAIVKGALVETVKTELQPESVELSGTVRARTTAMVAARIPGTVVMLQVREGDRVRKGQLLARLEAGESLAQAAAAVSVVDEARRALEEAQTRKKLADTTAERFSKLFNEQAVSRQEFDVKQAERELAVQGVARAEARLRQAQEGSKAAGTVADHTRITAPISGVVVLKQIDLGATVFPAQPLMTIEDEGSYQLELAVPESMTAKVKSGQAVQVSLDTVNQVVAARISEVVPAADSASRTFTARVNLHGKGLRSGLFGRVNLATGNEYKGILINRRAVVERGAMTSVWVVDKDKAARMRLVKLGKTSGGRVEILSGLTDGEQVVVSGIERISEGSTVQ